MLRWEKVTDYLQITVNPMDFNINFGFLPTVNDIKAYVEKVYGFKVHSAYIGQVKGKLGIREHENFNDSHTSPRKPTVCPAEKEAAIIEALKYFGLIKTVE